MLPVFDLDPVLRSSAAMGPVAGLRQQALKPKFASVSELVGPISPCSKTESKMPSGRREQTLQIYFQVFKSGGFRGPLSQYQISIFK
jgi:hypothetical protein